MWKDLLELIIIAETQSSLTGEEKQALVIEGLQHRGYMIDVETIKAITTIVVEAAQSPHVRAIFKRNCVDRIVSYLKK